LRQKRPNEEPGLIYSRINNPDLEMLEDRLAIWGSGRGQSRLRLAHGGDLDHETLKLRMTAAAEGACKVAGFLNTHPKFASVWYLGFLPEGHPDRPVFEHQCNGPGSTFSFEVKGGEAEAFAVLDRLKVIKLAVSLGGTETLASHPAR